MSHPFIQNWMDLLCFLLSGRPASGTLAAEIGFMFDDWFRPNAMLEFPKGGSEAVVNCLVRAPFNRSSCVRSRAVELFEGHLRIDETRRLGPGLATGRCAARLREA